MNAEFRYSDYSRPSADLHAQRRAKENLRKVPFTPLLSRCLRESFRLEVRTRIPGQERENDTFHPETPVRMGTSQGTHAK